jgi:hypothetical protein
MVIDFAVLSTSPVYGFGITAGVALAGGSAIALIAGLLGSVFGFEDALIAAGSVTLGASVLVTLTFMAGGGGFLVPVLGALGGPPLLSTVVPIILGASAVALAGKLFKKFFGNTANEDSVSDNDVKPFVPLHRSVTVRDDSYVTSGDYESNGGAGQFADEAFSSNSDPLKASHDRYKEAYQKYIALTHNSGETDPQEIKKALNAYRDAHARYQALKAKSGN